MSESTFIKGDMLKRWDTTLGPSPWSAISRNMYPQVNSEITDYLDKHSFHYSMRKGKHLFKVGEVFPYAFLVLQGAFRCYRIEDDREITTWFDIENSVLLSARGFTSLKPCIQYMQALEDSELMGIQYDKIQYLYNNHLESNIIGRRLFEEVHVDFEDRAIISRINNASRKYIFFMENYGHLVNRIPLKYIASYLGMTIETLSRIRSKMGQSEGNFS